MDYTSTWEPLPQRKKKKTKNLDGGSDCNFEIAKNIQIRSERAILPGTLEGLDGVRSEFYEC